MKEKKWFEESTKEGQKNDITRIIQQYVWVPQSRGKILGLKLRRNIKDFKKDFKGNKKKREAYSILILLNCT